jgi:hypothetical protein
MSDELPGLRDQSYSFGLRKSKADDEEDESREDSDIEKGSGWVGMERSVGRAQSKTCLPDQTSVEMYFTERETYH